ncbi:MAG: GntG family PLP-dependent aldolase [Steroidobacteraceae bacterium]
MMIDVRSDTVTQPTPAMLEAMLQAEVGDDVYGEDKTVNELQRRAAELFGKEAALFCPSGTMSNQIGIKVHTQPGDEVICDEIAHVYLYEGGGIAANSGASVRLLRGDRGRFTAAQVRDSINRRDDAHLPWTRLVAIENTVNRGGGCCWDLAEIARIRTVCYQHGVTMHLDGARLFNALVARNESPRDHGRLFDTISICLSKGLGAPAGSLLLGSRELIARAHRQRKLMGGGMRQSGYLAAAGLFALEHNIARLREDHAKARQLEAELRSLSYVSEVLPVETNIVIFRLDERIGTDAFLQQLQHQQVRATSMGRQIVRLVFHLDVDDAQLELLLRALHRVSLPG